MKLNDYFAFSKSERRAIAFLLAVILIMIILLEIKKSTRPADNDLTSLVPHDSLPMDTRRRPVDYTEGASLFAFNPNTADSATLRSLGLSPFVSANIVKYRRAGGSFRRPADLARIYGMDSIAFARIQPYIFIPQEKRAIPQPARQTVSQAQLPEGEEPIIEEYKKPLEEPGQSPYKEYMENKLHEGTFLDLNKADTTDLIRIPGIGPYYAKRIVILRQQLGGYVSPSQLKDIEGLPDIGDWVFIEPEAQERINVNTASLRTLSRHPYIGYTRARAIVDLRKREGRVLSLRQLSFLDEFSDVDIQRLTPYLSFE